MYTTIHSKPIGTNCKCTVLWRRYTRITLIHTGAHGSKQEHTEVQRCTITWEYIGADWCTLVHCTREQRGTHLCTLMYTVAQGSTQMHTGAHRCTQEHTGAQESTQVHTGAQGSTQVHTGAHGSTFHNGGARQSSAAWRLEGLRVIEASGPIITVTPSPPYWEPSTIWTFYTIYKYMST